MRRMFSLVGIITLAAVATAMIGYNKPFETTYKLGKDSDLAKAKCMVCHEKKTGGKMNAYGEDLKKVMDAAKSKKLTAELLKKVEAMDSDGDGKKNIDEIKADSNPGVK
jgi:hypothetical protein